MASLKLKSIHKTFDSFVALRDVSISVPDGAFVSLLGPSGCGKSTLLRIIAGLETPTSGTLTVDGTEITGLPPEKRDLSMMFQSFALFPHMTVAENLRFPLMMRRRNDADHEDKIKWALDLVRLPHVADRYPKQLSGGQQQRIALARGIICEPKILLLDEPLSKLDARLRDEMQVEIIELHRQLNLTTIFVTHDQSEALSLSDEIVLMSHGEIQQTGTPETIYSEPRNAFSADFMGAANILPGEIDQSGSTPRLFLPGGTSVPLPERYRDMSGKVSVVIRQEDLAFAPAGLTDGMPAVLVASVNLGPHVRHVLEVGEHRLSALLPKSAKPEGNEVVLTWPSDAIRLLTPGEK